jgi:hypothetical protein
MSIASPRSAVSRNRKGSVAKPFVRSSLLRAPWTGLTVSLLLSSGLDQHQSTGLSAIQFVHKIVDESLMHAEPSSSQTMGHTVAPLHFHAREAPRRLCYLAMPSASNTYLEKSWHSDHHQNLKSANLATGPQNPGERRAQHQGACPPQGVASPHIAPPCRQNPQDREICSRPN